MAAGDTGREPRAISLLVSVTLHVLLGLGIAASSWWWGTSRLDAWKTHTVSLVDVPLSMRQPSAPPQAAPPKAPPPPQPAAPTPAPPKAPPPPPKAAAKVPPPAPKPPKPKAVKPPPPRAALPAPKPKTPAPSRKKPAPAKPPPRVASSQEARSAVEVLRQRQAKREQERQQSQATRQQAASARVAALRDQLRQEERVGSAAVRTAGVQHVRLMAYQDRVRAEIIETWILPLAVEQTRNLQATAQFQVARNGEVSQLELVQPSGNTLFDASLLRAIRRASPLPALPADYPVDLLEVEMRFRAQ